MFTEFAKFWIYNNKIQEIQNIKQKKIKKKSDYFKKKIKNKKKDWENTES